MSTTGFDVFERPGVSGGVRVGTAGWQYDEWAGDFYPASLPKEERFAFYAEEFDTVEINNTFYGLPDEATFDHWRERAPPGFLYALKLGRYGTHMKHLKDPEDWVPNFVERARRLEDGLGPILVQLPPSWHADPERLRGFLEAAPEDLRWAVEVRDPSWLCDAIFDVLREFGAALCLHDMIEDHPWMRTTDWIYVRYHGGADYAGEYSHQKLSAEADRLADETADGRDVYVYFNNTAGNAVESARDLHRYLERREALHA